MKISGPTPSSFLLGNVGMFPKDISDNPQFVRGLAEKYGGNGAFKFFIGPIPTIFCVSPEIAKVLLGTSKHSRKSFLYFTLMPWLGTGLLTSEGAKWKSRRRLITPAFHFDILKRFLEVMNEQTDVLLDLIASKSEQGHVEVFELITLCTLDIIAETAMGKKIGAQSSAGQRNEYVEAVYKASELIILRGRKPWGLIDFIYAFMEEGKQMKKMLKVLHTFTRQVIKERRSLLAAELQTSKRPEGSEPAQRIRPAFLDLLLTAEEDGSPIDDEDIREEVDTFMFEGKPRDRSCPLFSCSCFTLSCPLPATTPPAPLWLGLYS